MLNPQADATARIVALAQNEALGLGHDWVGTEHVLLGLITANGTLPQRVLVELGLSADKVRDMVARWPQPSVDWWPRDHALTARAARLLEQAGQRAGSGRVRPESLLISLINEREASGAKILDALHVTPHMILSALGRLAAPT